MIDVLNENLIDLREAAKLPPIRTRTGKAAHISKMFRLAKLGVRASNGQRVRLETVRCPSGLRTSTEAVQRFIRELTDPDATAQTPASRQREVDTAEKELQQAGLA